MGKPNPGKLFEQDFKASVPEDWYFYRLRDSSGAWGGSEVTRFTPSNDFDCILYNSGTLWCLELKSVAGASIRFDALRPKQLRGLLDAANVDGVRAGVVVNLRGRGVTWYVPIWTWEWAEQVLDKKSFNLTDLLSWQETARDENWTPVLLPGARRVTRWRYDVTSLKEEG